MNTFSETTKDKENQLRNMKALSEDFVASLDKMEQSMLNLSKTIANLSKRYEAAMKPRECEQILDNFVTAY